jgi:pilus assembly protein CpaE
VTKAAGPSREKPEPIVVACDDRAMTDRIRRSLIRAGLEETSIKLHSLRTAMSQPVELMSGLLVVVLGADPEQAVVAIERVWGLNAGRLLAIGPASDPRLILRTLRGGADDYVGEDELDSELPKAIARWKEGRSGQSEPGRLVAVVSSSGGCGSSTIAASLGVALRQNHVDAHSAGVLLIDFRQATGDLAALLNVKPAYSLSDLCQNLDRIDRLFFESTLTKHDSGLQLLASPRRFDDPPIGPDEVRQILGLARASFPYIVVDVEPGLGEAALQVLRQADAVLLALRLEFSPLRNARLTLDHLERKGIEKSRIKPVVNRLGEPKQVPVDRAEDALGMKLFHLIPDDAATVIRANNGGVPVVLDAPKSKVALSLTKLAGALTAALAARKEP